MFIRFHYLLSWIFMSFHGRLAQAEEALTLAPPLSESVFGLKFARPK